jgi:hypothetical protein
MLNTTISSHWANEQREVLLFGRDRNKGVFATNQEGDTSAYHLKLTFLKNILLHLIIPNLIKIYIYFLNKIKKPWRPNTCATHTAGDPTLAQHHCRRPNVGAPSSHVAGLNVIAGDPSNQPTVCCRPAPRHTTVASARPTLPVFIVLGFFVANLPVPLHRRRSTSHLDSPVPLARHLDSNASEYKARSKSTRPRPVWSRAAGR